MWRNCCQGGMCKEKQGRHHGCVGMLPGHVARGADAVLLILYSLSGFLQVRESCWDVKTAWLIGARIFFSFRVTSHSQHGRFVFQKLFRTGHWGV